MAYNDHSFWEGLLTAQVLCAGILPQFYNSFTTLFKLFCICQILSKVKRDKVPIGGMSNRRGLNVVVIDTSMGQVLSAKTYDPWSSVPLSVKLCRSLPVETSSSFMFFRN